MFPPHLGHWCPHLWIQNIHHFKDLKFKIFTWAIDVPVYEFKIFTAHFKVWTWHQLNCKLLVWKLRSSRMGWMCQVSQFQIGKCLNLKSKQSHKKTVNNCFISRQLDNISNRSKLKKVETGNPPFLYFWPKKSSKKVAAGKLIFSFIFRAKDIYWEHAPQFLVKEDKLTWFQTGEWFGQKDPNIWVKWPFSGCSA